MRILLLLSALLTALAGSNAPACAASVPAAQVRAIDATKARSQVEAGSWLPSFVFDHVATFRVRILPTIVALVAARPLYAGRLRV